MKTDIKSKMYIAVLDEAPDYMVPTLVAHTMINAHINLNTYPEYRDWLVNSFKKVVLRVSRSEYEKIKNKVKVYYEGYENTICNAEGSCIVVLPSDDHPWILRQAKMWAPRSERGASE